MEKRDLRLQITVRQIVGMAAPISLALLVPQINFITNNIFLSGLGEQAYAAAGITGVFYLIFAVVGNGLNNGLQALISRRAGQNLHHEIGRMFYHGVWVALGFSAVSIMITYTVAPLILRASIHNSDIAGQVIDFLLIRIWGLPFFYLYVMRNALLVGTNQTRFLVWGTLAEAMANVFFDYGLIYGHFGLPEIGFNGAAYASIIAEATGLIVIYMVVHVKGMHRQFAFFEQKTFDRSLFRLILVQSSPLIVQYTISIMSWELFYILIEHHGSRALAISNGMRVLFGVFGIFSWAFASTTAAMVSNVIGQNRHDDVIPLIRKVAAMSFAVSVVICAILNVVPEWFLAVYGLGDEFVAEGIPVVRIVSVALLFMSFGTVWLNSVIGTGNTVVNLVIEGITIAVYLIYVFITLSWLDIPIAWGWASEWLYWLSMFGLAYAYMKSGRWKHKKI